VTLWLWILVGFCALALLMILAPAIAVLAAVKRVRAHVNAIAHSRLLFSIQSLQIQTTRLARTAGEYRSLFERLSALRDFKRRMKFGETDGDARPLVNR
jgi:hypothetical protein